MITDSAAEPAKPLPGFGPATAAELQRQHREILRAVREARAQDVTAAVDEHIRGWHGLLVERVGSPAAQREGAREYPVSGG